MSELSDKEILTLFANPDSRNYAFNLLVRKYQERIYWHIRKMIIDHDDTNDVMQNVFIKAFKGLANFREESQLFTWLYRIASNESLSQLSKKKRRFLLPFNDVEKELSMKVDSQAGPNALQIEIKLQKAILKLPEKQRLVFNMKYFDHLKYEEISEILGTSVGALKASYHHAVKKIEEYVLSS